MGEVMKDPRYEKLNDNDKKKLLDRVNDTIYNVIKSGYTDVKLTKLATAYKNGEPIDYFANFENSSGLDTSTKKPTSSTTSKTTAKKPSTSSKVSRFNIPTTDRSLNLSTSTLASLQNLLASTTIKPRSSGSKNVVLKKYNVKGA